MSYNGNGVFLINTPGQPVVSGTTITSTAFNALTTDLASGLTNAITKDGQTNITANIPMSNFKITGLGAGTNPNDAVRLAQIQDGIINGRFVNLEYTGTFTGGTGVVNLGSGQFYKAVGGNVGIGTSSPQSKLSVSNAGAAGIELVTNYPGGGVGTYIQSYNRSTSAYIDTAYYANSHTFWANGDAMVINSSGNVGIGTTPIAKLDINGSVGVANRSLKIKPSANGADISNLRTVFIENANNDGTLVLGFSTATDAWIISSTFGSTGAYKPLVFATSDAEKMRINNNGNVGIGTISPAYTLDVQATTGIISATSTTGTNFSKVQVNNTGGSFQLGIDNSTGTNYGSTAAYARCVWNDSATAPTILYTNSAERMRIDASGNVSIKVTSAIGRFNVQSDDSATAIAAGNVSGTAAYNGALFYNNGFTSLVGQISISGSTASYLSVSDYRLKESVAPMTGALATVAQLKPVTYKWKADGSDGQGFIAHELQAVVPDCVTGDKDAVDDEGKPKYQGVDTSFLVATLTAALQESHQLIKDLQVRVAALEA